MGKPEGKRPIGGHTRRWVCNIKVDLKKMRWECLDCLDLVQSSGR